MPRILSSVAETSIVIPPIRCHIQMTSRLGRTACDAETEIAGDDVKGKGVTTVAQWI